MHWWKEGKVRLVHRGTELSQGGRLDCRTNTYTDGFYSWSPVQVEWLPEVEVEPEPIAFNWPAEWLSEPVVPEITDTSVEFNADVVVSDPLTTAAGKDRPQIHCRKDAIQAAVDWGLVEVDDSDTVLSFKCSQVGLKRIVATFAPEQTPKTKRAWRDWLARNEGWLIEEFAGDGVTEIEWLK